MTVVHDVARRDRFDSPTHVRDGDPAGVERNVERPGSRLTEVFFVTYRVPYRVPVFVAHVEDSLEAQTPKTRERR